METRIIQVKPLTYFFFLILVMAMGCKKSSTLVYVPSEAHFANTSSATYFVTGPNVVKKILIGLTDVSTVDRTINFTVTSPTGAIAGTHYNILGGNSILIPAGKALDSITVAGVFNQYTTGRKDSLIFTITDGTETKASSYNRTFKLFMRGPCSESETVLADLRGSYSNTNEDFGGTYGPYVTTISATTQITATTGTIVVTNIFDFGWNPITFILEWTNPLNTRVVLVEQTGIGDAGTLNPAYSGMDITVRPFLGETGTFSWCNNKITLKMQVGVTGLGFFPNLYTVVMER
jgi:hypothetical protein